MERVDIDAMDPTGYGDGAERRALSEALSTADVAVNHYRIPPGEGFPGGLHAHTDQEELFVVLAGATAFQWLAPERDAARELTVGEGEAVRFAPGEFQSGRNAGEDLLVALALGASRDSEDVRVPLDCPECGHRDLHPVWDGDGALLVCPDCDAESVPEGCPECGAEMRVALGEPGTVGESTDGTRESETGVHESADGVRTVVVCPDCGVEAATPFGE